MGYNGHEMAVSRCEVGMVRAASLELLSSCATPRVGDAGFARGDIVVLVGGLLLLVLGELESGPVTSGSLRRPVSLMRRIRGMEPTARTGRLSQQKS